VTAISAGKRKLASTAVAGPRQQIFYRRKQPSHLSIGKMASSLTGFAPVLGHVRSRHSHHRRPTEVPFALGPDDASTAATEARPPASRTQTATPVGPIGQTAVPSALGTKPMSRGSLAEAAREVWANATSPDKHFPPEQHDSYQLVTDVRNTVQPDATSARTNLAPTKESAHASATEHQGDSRSQLDKSSSPMLMHPGQDRMRPMNLDLTESSPLAAKHLQPKLQSSRRDRELEIKIQSTPLLDESPQARHLDSAKDSLRLVRDYQNMPVADVRNFHATADLETKKLLISSIKHDFREIKRILMTSKNSSKNTAAVDEEVRAHSQRNLSRLTSSKGHIDSRVHIVGHKTVNADYLSSEVAEKASLIESLFLDQQ
jgi:hypothetical protein